VGKPQESTEAAGQRSAAQVLNRRMELTRQTLMYLFRGEVPAREVLLGHKLRGFGEGKVMGVGGHVEAGESDL